jgi:hypothetical protein
LDYDQHHLAYLRGAMGSATMNQLYHPERSAEFFTMLAQNSHIQVFTVTNNVVHDLATEDDNKKKTLDGVWKFLAQNWFAPLHTFFAQSGAPYVHFD